MSCQAVQNMQQQQQQQQLQQQQGAELLRMACQVVLSMSRQQQQQQQVMDAMQELAWIGLQSAPRDWPPGALSCSDLFSLLFSWIKCGVKAGTNEECGGAAVPYQALLLIAASWHRSFSGKQKLHLPQVHESALVSTADCTAAGSTATVAAAASVLLLHHLNSRNGNDDKSRSGSKSGQDLDQGQDQGPTQSRSGSGSGRLAECGSHTSDPTIEDLADMLAEAHFFMGSAFQYMAAASGGKSMALLSSSTAAFSKVRGRRQRIDRCIRPGSELSVRLGSCVIDLSIRCGSRMIDLSIRCGSRMIDLIDLNIRCGSCIAVTHVITPAGIGSGSGVQCF
jgi:hypothetical protein